MISRRRATRAALWAAAASWGEQVANFVISPIILARMLGPEAYGLVGMALLVTALGQVFVAESGWDEALIQRQRLDPEHKDVVFWVLLILGSLLMLAAILLAEPVARFFGQPELARMVRWLCLLLPLSSLAAVPAALLRRELEFRILALRATASIVVGGLVGISLGLLGYGVWSLVAYQLSRGFTDVVVAWAAVRWRPGLSLSWRHLAELQAFGLSVSATKMLTFTNMVLPRLLIGYLLGPVALGYYVVARRIFDLMNTLLVNPLSRVAVSTFARVQADSTRVREVLFSGTETSALIAFPSFGGLLVLAPEVMPLVFGERWSEAVPIVQLLALIGLVAPIVTLNRALMRGLGRVGWELAVSAAGTVLFAFLLVPASRAGAIAIVSAIVVRRWVMAPIMLLVTSRITKIDTLGLPGRCAHSFLATLAMGGVVVAWHHFTADALPRAALVATSISLGVVVYVVSMSRLNRPLLKRALRLLPSP